MAKRKVTRKPAKRKTAAKKATTAKKTISKTAATALAGKHMRARDKRKSYGNLVKKYGRTIASRIVKMANKMEAAKAKAKNTTSAKKKQFTYCTIHARFIRKCQV